MDGYMYMYLPREIIDIILEYDGRIKYRKGVYTNIISKRDERYICMDAFIRRKIKIFQRIKYSIVNKTNRFFFTIEFESMPKLGLIYDCYFTNFNHFTIHFYNYRFPDSYIV